MSHPFNPLISIMALVSTLMVIVIAKMEVRRLGYSVYRLSQSERLVQDDVRKKNMRFAQLTRPERIENYAQTRLELRRAGHGQVIQLVSDKVAFKH